MDINADLSHNVTNVKLIVIRGSLTYKAIRNSSWEAVLLPRSLPPAVKYISRLVLSQAHFTHLLHYTSYVEDISLFVYEWVVALSFDRVDVKGCKSACTCG